MKIKQISVDVEKSLSVNYNSVRLRMSAVGEFQGQELAELDDAFIALKQHLEQLLDTQLLKSVQALPRLKKRGEELSNDIPY